MIISTLLYNNKISIRSTHMNQLELCVLDSNEVLPHEHYDSNRVAKLADGLETTNILRNPPIATEW